MVVGASSGLGRAIALGLSGAGVRVVGAGRDGNALAETAALSSSELRVVSVDVTDREATEDLIGRAEELVGALDIAVLAQGIATPRPIAEHDDEAWDATLETNLTSVFRIARRVGTDMAERGRGKIITVASMLSFSGGLNVAAYAASKGGIAQLTKALANELAPRGVNVNAIAPGYIQTRANAHIWRDDPKRRGQILERLPAGRWGEPDDVVGPALFLASSASDYVHGVILPVDGGWLSR